MSIEIVNYLETTSADVRYSGVNIGSNDVAMPCLWCDDDSYHMTINRSNGYLNCWRCNFDEYKQNHPKSWRPSFKALIKELEQCSWRKAKEILESIGGDVYEPDNEEPIKKEVCELPKSTKSFDSPGQYTGVRDRAYNYLKSRNFGKYHIEKHKMLFCPTGYYQYRIIIPVYFDGVLVNWIARSFNPNDSVRYLNCKIDNCIERFSNILYGSELCSSNTIRLVEGFFDKMRIGDSALALNRSQFSKKQRNIILGLKQDINYFSIILDPEAEFRAIQIAEDLAPFIDNIKIVKLPAGSDPANLEYNEIMYHESNTQFYRF